MQKMICDCGCNEVGRQAPAYPMAIFSTLARRGKHGQLRCLIITDESSCYVYKMRKNNMLNLTCIEYEAAVQSGNHVRMNEMSA